MIKRLRTWWQRTNKPIFVLEAMVFLVVIIVIILGYWLTWNWTGFSAKTLWDWLQLLFVPIILAIGGFWLNQIQKSREERTAKHRTEDEQKIATDNQHEAALQAYIGNMSELLLNEHLGELTPEGKPQPEYNKVRQIARVRTLIVLERLDTERKRNVFLFLLEAGLIDKDKTIIGLRRAHLDGVNLRGAHLSKTHLSGVDLKGADLSEANLSGADLMGTDLRGAKLNRTNCGKALFSGADLSGADLSEADLREANLGAMYFNEAEISPAFRSGADLIDVGGGRVKLREARVTQEQLEKAKSLQDATMPDGSKHY
jgi:Pentapeptide repeats (8 copies)